MISVIYFYPIGIKTCLKLFYPRCATCKKKLGLTGFTCRCGGLFCSIHRYSDKHQCDFDYKVIISLKLVSFGARQLFCDFTPQDGNVKMFQALGAEEITRSNPVVVAQKVAKI